MSFYSSWAGMIRLVFHSHGIFFGQLHLKFCQKKEEGEVEAMNVWRSP